MERELGMCAQRAGPTGGIVRADLQQCEATWDIRHCAGVRARLAHYLPIGSNDPQDMQHEVALRWYGTGADEKVEDLPFVRGLRRCEGAHDDPNLRFLTGRSTPQGETYSKNLKVTRNRSFETKDGALQRRFSCAAMRRGDGRSCSHMQGGRPESVCACCDGRLARSELRDCLV